jgi:Tfp pilus assembly protein PilF
VKPLTIGLLLCSLAGCSGLSGRGPADPSDLQSEGPPPQSRGLPRDQAAELCETAGRELEQNGKGAEAIVQYERARQLDPARVHVARRLAVLYDRKGNFDRAGVEYQKALALSPHDADLFNDIGSCHEQRGDLVEAENWLRGALDQKPGHQRATVNLGGVLAKQGRYDESLQAFLQALPPAQAYCKVGVQLARGQLISEARAAFHEALRLDPQLKQASAFLAHLDRPASPNDPRQVAKAEPR